MIVAWYENREEIMEDWIEMQTNIVTEGVLEALDNVKIS